MCVSVCVCLCLCVYLCVCVGVCVLVLIRCDYITFLCLEIPIASHPLKVTILS